MAGSQYLAGRRLFAGGDLHREMLQAGASLICDTGGSAEAAPLF